MKNQSIATTLLLPGLLLFNYLFWQESLGINLLIFSSLLVSIAYFREKQSHFRREIYFGIGLSIATGIMAVWHNSGWSNFMHFLTVFLTIGFIKQKEITTVFESAIGFFVTYFSTPIAWFKAMKERKKENKAVAFTYSFIKLCVIPLVLFILFFIIYKNANPKFAALTASFSKSIAELFKDFSFARFAFLLLGFSFLSVAFVKATFSIGPFVQHEDNLSRRRKKNGLIKQKVSQYSELMNEYKVGLLIFGMLNALLFIVNCIDISWIWFGFEVPDEFDLKTFVHEGTYLLIFSILLSMGIFLYFFRGSLNFFSKNKWLLLLGKVWIAQNIILTLSVFIRNYHYIGYHGLAGKRIGVIAFLLMTVFGLLSLIYKANNKKTTAFLVRLNGWFITITMSVMTLINWDRVIVDHNLSHANPGEIDVDYYLKLDETVAPTILANLDVIESQMEAHKNREGKMVYLRYLDIETFKNQLNFQVNSYLTEKENNTWVSWNWTDYQFRKNLNSDKNQMTQN